MAQDMEKELQSAITGYKKLGSKIADDITDKMLVSVKSAIKRQKRGEDNASFKDTEEYFDMEMEGANMLAAAFLEGFNQAWIWFHDVN